MDSYCDVLEQYGVKRTKYQPTGNALQYYKEGKQVVDLLKLLYSNSSVYLDRKFERTTAVLEVCE